MSRISKTSPFRALAPLLCLLALAAPRLFSLDLTVTIIDADLEIPLEGAKVLLEDGSEVTGDRMGRARLSVPEDRAAILRISYPGYQSGRFSVPPGTAAYTAALRLRGAVTERELVIEAARPSGETVSGRSVGISGRDLARQAESGFVEDVMRAVKLLPGVGYVGGYMSMPSVRGGEPSDITAVFDGFYVERPYHWGGVFSIFDPKMVESARLSHGIFSARYGHTISGLLDIRAKSPSPDAAEVDLAVSTSSANANVSLPLGKTAPERGGGVFLMGKITYWDAFVWGAKQLSKVVDSESLDLINAVSTAPYIRSSALSASYAFSTDLSLSLNGFFGGDGVGASYTDYAAASAYEGEFFWDNKLGFLTSGLGYNPREDTLLRFRLGAGLLRSDLTGKVHSENREVTPTSLDDLDLFLSDRTVNVQARFDLDRDLGGGFLLALGMEERYSRWNRNQRYHRLNGSANPLVTDLEFNVKNHGLSSALYTVLEYRPENRRYGLELGLRGDHFLLAGKDFVLPGIPTVNPRLNLDLNLLEGAGPVDSLSLTFGTGLFSSIDNDLQNIEGRSDISGWTSTMNQSWTNLAGTKIDLAWGLTFTLEGYVKYVFDRSYVKAEEDSQNPRGSQKIDYFFDGQAFIWGFDCMLQKFDSRYWDGWIAYSYINARYRDPQSGSQSKNFGDWYYPDFHRFHTLHLILNYKPVQAVHLSTRFSLASGVPIPKTVAIVDDNEVPGPPPPWKRIQTYANDSRAGWVIPLDVKLSFFSFHKNGKARREIYLSLENLLSLAYRAETVKDFDANTGRETPGSRIASYDLPIPLLTFGVKWSY
ncbi:MAG: TonB-dependent receptor plug domain-containing protein [Treponema sp.]|jgi:hypothetical protein|nr:TonB-dependent receptor plug domain-containing protein [Treponema sp.]